MRTDSASCDSRPLSTASRRLFGFTLLELLTVIAIIGILAAILIPVVNKVRQTARFSTNVSNVRQWTVACALHIQDWKGYMPYQGNGTTSAASANDVTPFPSIGVLPWWNALPPYMGEQTLAERVANGGSLPKIGENSVWVSPNAELTVAGKEWAAFLCYAPARSSNTLESSAANRYVANISKIIEPSRTVMFAETPHFSRALRNGTPYPFINAISSPNSTGPFNRNGDNQEDGGLRGKAALGFFDGSVRTLTGAQIQTHGTTTAAERGNNPDRIVWRLTPN